MFKNGPIIIIEDDADDQELLKEVFRELQVSNILKFFDSCAHALNYLVATMEKPFLIISDIKNLSDCRLGVDDASQRFDDIQDVTKAPLLSSVAIHSDGLVG